MPRVAKKSTKTKDTEKLVCSCCGKEKATKEFYNSYSLLNSSRKKMNVCKNCISAMVKNLVGESDDIKIGIYRTCRYLDIPFDINAFNGAFSESGYADNLDVVLNGLNIWKKYITKINSLPQYSQMTFENGDVIYYEKENEKEDTKLRITAEDKQNEYDVINMLKFDPFESENQADRKYLFNRIVDMLDESVLSDNMKLMSVIEIVKGFNQVDKINSVMATITGDMAKLSANSGNIRTLTSTKKDLTTSILKIAEENRISEKHSGVNTAGSGTLSGMIKKLSEIDLDEAKVNLFDINTSLGMKQTANLSNEAIMNQLMLAENDYADMVAYQRQQMQHYQKEYEKLREENRRLKVVCKNNNVDYSTSILQEDYKELEYNDEVKNQIELEKKEIEEISKDAPQRILGK